MLPNFLGIGAQRCGTTWLHEQLLAHPEVYLPSRRKEVHFFCDNFDRGTRWYEAFFASAGRRAGVRVVGEITPKYVFVPEVPRRIRDTLGTDVALVAMFRNPAERLFSQYCLEQSFGRFTGTLEQFIDSDPTSFARGQYSVQLERYLETFGSGRLQVLVYEDVFASAEGSAAALRAVAAHLGISTAGFDASRLTERVNRVTPPRFPAARALAKRVSDQLRAWDADWPVSAAKRAGALRLFGRASQAPEFPVATRRRLIERYEPDVRRMESLLGRPLESWRSPV